MQILLKDKQVKLKHILSDIEEEEAKATNQAAIIDRNDYKPQQIDKNGGTNQQEIVQYSTSEEDSSQKINQMGSYKKDDSFKNNIEIERNEPSSWISISNLKQQIQQKPQNTTSQVANSTSGFYSDNQSIKKQLVHQFKSPQLNSQGKFISKMSASIDHSEKDNFIIQRLLQSQDKNIDSTQTQLIQQENSQAQVEMSYQHSPSQSIIHSYRNNQSRLFDGHNYALEDPESQELQKINWQNEVNLERLRQEQHDQSRSVNIESNQSRSKGRIISNNQSRGNNRTYLGNNNSSLTEPSSITNGKKYTGQNINKTIQPYKQSSKTLKKSPQQQLISNTIISKRKKSQQDNKQALRQQVHENQSYTQQSTSFHTQNQVNNQLQKIQDSSLYQNAQKLKPRAQTSLQTQTNKEIMQQQAQFNQDSLYIKTNIDNNYEIHSTSSKSIDKNLALNLQSLNQFTSIVCPGSIDKQGQSFARELHQEIITDQEGIQPQQSTNEDDPLNKLLNTYDKEYTNFFKRVNKIRKSTSRDKLNNQGQMKFNNKSVDHKSNNNKSFLLGSYRMREQQNQLIQSDHIKNIAKRDFSRDHAQMFQVSKFAFQNNGGMNSVFDHTLTHLVESDDHHQIPTSGRILRNARSERDIHSFRYKNSDDQKQPQNNAISFQLKAIKNKYKSKFDKSQQNGKLIIHTPSSSGSEHSQRNQQIIDIEEQYLKSQVLSGNSLLRDEHQNELPHILLKQNTDREERYLPSKDKDDKYRRNSKSIEILQRIMGHSSSFYQDNSHSKEQIISNLSSQRNSFMINHNNKLISNHQRNQSPSMKNIMQKGQNLIEKVNNHIVIHKNPTDQKFRNKIEQIQQSQHELISNRVSNISNYSKNEQQLNLALVNENRDLKLQILDLKKILNEKQLSQEQEQLQVKSLYEQMINDLKQEYETYLTNKESDFLIERNKLEGYNNHLELMLQESMNMLVIQNQQMQQQLEIMQLNQTNKSSTSKLKEQTQTNQLMHMIQQMSPNLKHWVNLNKQKFFFSPNLSSMEQSSQQDPQFSIQSMKNQLLVEGSQKQSQQRLRNLLKNQTDLSNINRNDNTNQLFSNETNFNILSSQSPYKQEQQFNPNYHNNNQSQQQTHNLLSNPENVSPNNINFGKQVDLRHEQLYQTYLEDQISPSQEDLDSHNKSDSERHSSNYSEEKILTTVNNQDYLNQQQSKTRFSTQPYQPNPSQFQNLNTQSNIFQQQDSQGNQLFSLYQNNQPIIEERFETEQEDDDSYYKLINQYTSDKKKLQISNSKRDSNAKSRSTSKKPHEQAYPPNKNIDLITSGVINSETSHSKILDQSQIKKPVHKQKAIPIQSRNNIIFHPQQKQVEGNNLTSDKDCNYNSSSQSQSVQYFNQSNNINKYGNQDQSSFQMKIWQQNQAREFQIQLPGLLQRELQSQLFNKYQNLQQK
eukprot:403336612